MPFRLEDFYRWREISSNCLKWKQLPCTDLRNWKKTCVHSLEIHDNWDYNWNWKLVSTQTNELQVGQIETLDRLNSLVKSIILWVVEEYCRLREFVLKKRRLIRNCLNNVFTSTGQNQRSVRLPSTNQIQRIQVEYSVGMATVKGLYYIKCQHRCFNEKREC